MKYSIHKVYDIRKHIEDIEFVFYIIGFLFIILLISAVISIVKSKYTKKIESIKLKDINLIFRYYIYCFPIIFSGLIGIRFLNIIQVNDEFTRMNVKFISGKIYDHTSSSGNSCGFEDFRINGIKFGLTNSKMNMQKKYIQLVKDGANAVVIFEPYHDKCGRILRLDTISIKD